jgi:hypothetical protein
MTDGVAMRATVESLMTRVLAGGETALAEELIHPEFGNNEADPERRNRSPTDPPTASLEFTPL